MVPFEMEMETANMTPLHVMDPDIFGIFPIEFGRDIHGNNGRDRNTDSLIVIVSDILKRNDPVDRRHNIETHCPLPVDNGQ